MPTIIINGVPTYVSADDYNTNYVAPGRQHIDIGTDGTWSGITDTQLDTIKINGVAFRGISDLSTVNTKTYVEEPTRSNDGSIPNINDYETFYVPRVKFNFKFFTIADYMAFCIAVQPNEFNVEYFDKTFGMRVSHKMYIEPEELTSLYNIETKVIGILDYEISLIGTNNDMNTYSLSYNINGGGSLISHLVYSAGATYDPNDIVQSTSSSGIYYRYINSSSTSGHALTETDYWEIMNTDMINTQTLNWGEGFTVIPETGVSDYYTITAGYTLTGFNTMADGSGFSYYPNQSASIFNNLVLYCQWSVA